MIVKAKYENGWLFLDNIESVNVFNEKKVNSDKRSCQKYWDLSKDKLPNDYYVKSLVLHKKPDVVWIVGCPNDDTQCYILNDEGKTIERIN